MASADPRRYLARIMKKSLWPKSIRLAGEVNLRAMEDKFLSRKLQCPLSHPLKISIIKFIVNQQVVTIKARHPTQVLLADLGLPKGRDIMIKVTGTILLQLSALEMGTKATNNPRSQALGLVPIRKALKTLLIIHLNLQ